MEAHVLLKRRDVAEAAKQPEQYISIEPGHAGGDPHIVGRRIKVRDVAVWHERMGLSVDEIAFQYRLEVSEIYAALSYYFAHREAIDESIRERDDEVETASRSTSSKLQLKLKGRRGE